MNPTDDIRSQREAAYEACKVLLPTRYTSDPGVIDNPDVMAAVKTEWEVYFEAMNDVLRRFPYTEEEKRRNPVICDTHA